MVDREHVSWAESSPEEVDHAGQEGPPGGGSAEEPGDDEHGAEESADGMVGHLAARDFEGGEEGEDIGDDHDEVLDVSFKSSARLILLIVSEVAEHDGDVKVCRIDARKEEEEGEHHRRGRALRDVLEADTAEDLGGQ